MDKVIDNSCVPSGGGRYPVIVSLLLFEDAIVACFLEASMLHVIACVVE